MHIDTHKYTHSGRLDRTHDGCLLWSSHRGADASWCRCRNDVQSDVIRYPVYIPGAHVWRVCHRVQLKSEQRAEDFLVGRVYFSTCMLHVASVAAAWVVVIHFFLNLQIGHDSEVLCYQTALVPLLKFNKHYSNQRNCFCINLIVHYPFIGWRQRTYNGFFFWSCRCCAGAPRGRRRYRRSKQSLHEIYSHKRIDIFFLFFFLFLYFRCYLHFTMCLN